MPPLVCNGAPPIYCSYRAHRCDIARRHDGQQPKPSSSSPYLPPSKTHRESPGPLRSSGSHADQNSSVILADDFFIHPWQTTDAEAAECVVRHFLNRNLDPRQVEAERRLLRLLLSSPLPEPSLLEVVRCADILFFEGLLGPNIDLRWSSGDEVGQQANLNGGGWEGDMRGSAFRSASGHAPHGPRNGFVPVIIGTTVLRSTRSDAFEARVILSDSVLQSGWFDQRLVLSTILHETIHAYLFVKRGLPAMACGGHTTGFKAIARFLDEWIGDPEYLRLSHDQADLRKFQVPSGDDGDWDQAVVENFRVKKFHGGGWDPKTRAWGQKGVDFKLTDSRPNDT